jgi:cytosine/adenosine deaminase-related metal-dependent hydrolase
MADVGYLVAGALLVHAVHLTDDGLEKIRRAKAVLVTCPRSNLWVGAGPPRLSHFFASGAPVAIGTDSLASAPTLNMFDELAEMRRLAPELAAPTLLDSATRRGADALGFGRDYGTLAPGKRAVLVAVDVPAAERDVEEYLVSGVTAGAIRRVA